MRTRSSRSAPPPAAPRTAVLLPAALVVVLALAGCGADSGDPTVQPGGSMTSESAASSASPDAGGSRGAQPSPPPSARPSLPPSKYPPTELTITGRPEEGVESGCVVMRSGATVYQLIGGDRELLRSGRQVVVRGRPEPGLMTTCQQGTPFRVSEVRTG